MRTSEEIRALYIRRKEVGHPRRAKMLEILRHYEGRMVVPLPELDNNEKPAIANLILSGIEQYSQRVASVQPDIYFPPVRPGFDNSEEKARQRRLAALGWWDMNQMQNLSRYRARFLVAYGEAPVIIRPVSPKVSDKREIPFWRAIDPLQVYLPQPEYAGDIEPANAIISYEQSLDWLMSRYPAETRLLNRGMDQNPNRRFELLEYVDDSEITLIAIGAADERRSPHDSEPMGMPSIILEQIPNRIGICPLVAPRRITLKELAGHFDQLPGMYHRAAKLDALQTIAVQRAIFAEEWAVGHPNAIGQVDIVEVADGRAGKVGKIVNGQIQAITPQPGVQTMQAIDTMERNQRVTAGMPSEMGGESATNIRTARRGEQVLASAIDAPIGEYQDIFTESAEAEMVRAIATAKAFWGSKPTSFYVSRTGKGGYRPDYTPDVAFEWDVCFVKYSIPGADAAAIPIEIGQRIGTGEMSLQTAREMDPVIEDPIRERDQVELEGLRRALLSALETGAAQGALDPAIIARLAQIKSEKHVQLEDAMAELAKEQAAQQAQQQQNTPPVPGPEGPGGPSALPPGAPSPTAPPGAPGQQPPGATPPAIGPPPGGQGNLAQILQTLRRPANQGAPERALGQ